jgi:site-specific DNA-methyltransferase (adenine-specific)
MSKHRNKLYYGDNLEVLRKYIKDETVDLCYIDPPFNSKRNYNQIYTNVGQEDKAQAQAFVDTWTWDKIAIEGLPEITSNYNGVFTSQSINLILGFEKVLGRGSLLAYIVSMTLRIAEIFRVLKPTGSFYLHCDPTASHYLKLIIDAIFCPKGGDFRNEIVWCYTAPSKVVSHFPRKHDTIFFYTKGEPRKLNLDAIRVPYSKESISRANRNVTKKGGTIYDHVELHAKGKIPEDWWADIVPASRKPGERLGYPTQKPEELLQRIIRASSNEGDLILDAYCGCGTTIVMAEQLNRRWIGMDITYQSISLVLKRLEEHFGKTSIANISLTGVPQDIDSAIALAHKEDDRLRKEFEKWAVLTFSENMAIINEKKGGDRGIDGISFVSDTNEKNESDNKEILFSVKSNETLSPSVIRDLNGTMEREGAAMGYLITLYSMANLVRESKKYGTYKNRQFGHSYQKIEVINVQEILDGRRMDLPISLEVLRKAEQKFLSDQINLPLP